MKRPDVLSQARATYRADPESKKKRVRARRLREPDKVRGEKRTEYLRHRDEYIARAAAWASENPARSKELQARWRKENPERVNHHAAMNHAGRLKRRPRWLTQEHKREIRSTYASANALTRGTGEQYSVDHIVPLQGERVSGLHVPWNLQVMTLKANRVKSNGFNPERG